MRVDYDMLSPSLFALIRQTEVYFKKSKTL
jgi:hypothetical protein